MAPATQMLIQGAAVGSEAVGVDKPVPRSVQIRNLQERQAYSVRQTFSGASSHCHMQTNSDSTSPANRRELLVVERRPLNSRLGI
jgi:hypothetical protein